MNQKTSLEFSEALGAELFGPEDTIVEDAIHDSRQARPGAVFAAIKGFTMDGHKFVEDVVRRGAAGIISEMDPPTGFEACWFKVKDTREALATGARFVHNNPSSKLDLVGITGTNGKTTTTYLINAVATAADRIPSMLSTVEYRIGDDSRPAVRTTPEASDTQRFLAEAVSKGSRLAVMEASSQALHLRRCDGLEFRATVFTNLTRDHLDYHGTMENYFDAKKMLFDGRIGAKPGVAIINVDDEWGLKLVNELNSIGVRVITFAQNTNADFTSSDIVVSLNRGTSFLMKTPDGDVEIESPLVGKPHVYNMLAASAVAAETGIAIEQVRLGLSESVGAPGRFERVPNEEGLAVIVDYAHSDDALENTLRTARELCSGRVITVFGCGGDRDKTKREPMGRIAARLSDVVYVTSDNPRTEDPSEIISDIEIGLKAENSDYKIEADRKDAIFGAIMEAGTEDVVIIAGKGHETYQIIGGDKFHFDDREIALEALQQKEI